MCLSRLKRKLCPYDLLRGLIILSAVIRINECYILGKRIGYGNLTVHALGLVLQSNLIGNDVSIMNRPGIDFIAVCIINVLQNIP